ncbi:hypothetical protein A2165_00760 [Candidatus Curtissbacteria bacterium RBG_13_40_7]|uniref:Uncharacterized protein n=1 Tax=Candidatus Curtissbacteria bacterium RBG_13_40_7 TaxID=1797706 RepID=A0A1F5FUF2_9BACT|nr:MAG: hypothetical protein A2165_00760 [Candidatus Curtissbacteria bacterium RBG_13_40_7]
MYEKLAQKIIVTHLSPDFDGIPAIWLLKRFHPEFESAKVAFVPVGDTTYDGQPVDTNPNIVHVDTGMGKFDHHQTNAFTCAAKLIYEWLEKEGYIEDNEALKRLIEVVTQIDHGWDINRWPEAADDKYEFLLHNVLVGWKLLYPRQDENHVEWTMRALDSIYRILQLKVDAGREIEEGLKFTTRWGKGVAVYTANDMVMDLAIKNDFAVVVRKDPGKGYLRVTGSTCHKVNLTTAYEMFRKKDPEASWFLHASKVLLRNGSTRNPTMKPTKLGIEEVVEVLRKA